MWEIVCMEMSTDRVQHMERRVGKSVGKRYRDI